MNTYYLDKQLLAGLTDGISKQLAFVIDEILRGIPFIWVGERAHLPSVADKPLYQGKPTSSNGKQGHLIFMYSMFKKVLKLTVNHQVGGSDPEQERFRDLLTCLCKGESTVNDWKLL